MTYCSGVVGAITTVSLEKASILAGVELPNPCKVTFVISSRSSFFLVETPKTTLLLTHQPHFTPRKPNVRPFHHSNPSCLCLHTTNISISIALSSGSHKHHRNWNPFRQSCHCRLTRPSIALQLSVASLGQTIDSLRKICSLQVRKL